MQLVLLDLWGLSSENILQKVAHWREYEIKENASFKKKKKAKTLYTTFSLHLKNTLSSFHILSSKTIASDDTGTYVSSRFVWFWGLKCMICSGREYFEYPNATFLKSF